MAAFSEVSTSQQRRLAEIISRYHSLDDALFILQNDLGRMKRIIEEYGLSLKDVVGGFVDKPSFVGISQDAQDAFYESLKTYIENGKLDYRRTATDTLVKSFTDAWGNQVNRMVDTITTNLFARDASFKSMAEAALIPLRRIADIKAYEITSVVIDGKQYNYEQLQNIWTQMNDSYGQRDTIQFRNGVNYPMRTYVDGRAATTQVESHRLGTIIEGSSNGVYFGTVNKTGTTDSCVYHENEIFFLTDGARAEALAKWPDIDRLKKMSTWEEIVADDTHMGKFGCKHIVRALAIQFFSDQRFRDALANGTGMPVPEKISERKIFEKVTGRKWVNAGRSSSTNSFQPIPPRIPINRRYTIA